MIEAALQNHCMQAYITRARLTVCEVGIFSRETSQLSKIHPPPSLRNHSHGQTLPGRVGRVWPPETTRSHLKDQCSRAYFREIRIGTTSNILVPVLHIHVDIFGYLLTGSHGCHSRTLLLSWQHAYLFDSHHGLHELGGVSEGQTGQTTVPVHQVVINVSSH